MNEIQENLIQLIKEDGETPVLDLSRKTKIPQPTLHHIISGKTKKPRKYVLETLALYFGVTINQLTGKEDLPERITPEKIQRHEGGKYIPIMNYLNNRSEEKMLLIEASASFNLALHLDTNEFEPIFPRGSVLIGQTGAENLEDRSFIFIRHKNDKSEIGKAIIEDNNIFVMLDKQIYPISEIEANFILGISEIRRKM